MAQLIQCDFCGNITNQIAAQIVINFRSSQVSSDVLREYADMATYKDCCVNCIKKFMEPKPVPLAITPSGQPVKEGDL